jgi:hypothetical protein
MLWPDEITAGAGNWAAVAMSGGNTASQAATHSPRCLEFCSTWNYILML